jgi:hypothetical protein
MLQQEKASLLPQNDTHVSLLEDAVLKKVFQLDLLIFPGSFHHYFASFENSDETDELEFRGLEEFGGKIDIYDLFQWQTLSIGHA